MLMARAEVTHHDDHIHVNIIWSGASLDRPTTGGFGLKPTHGKLAQRLCLAINAQAVYVNPVVAYDINGKSYVRADCRVAGRHLNADLKRLGY